MQEDKNDNDKYKLAACRYSPTGIERETIIDAYRTKRKYNALTNQDYSG